MQMQNSTPSITPYAQQCIQAYLKYLPALIYLESFYEAETDDAKLLLIGNLITDIDDMHNTGQHIWGFLNLFYKATDKYFEDPYVQHLITHTP